MWKKNCGYAGDNGYVCGYVWVCVGMCVWCIASRIVVGWVKVGYD